MCVYAYTWHSNHHNHVITIIITIIIIIPPHHRDVHNDTLRILRFAIDEFVNNDTAARANDFMDFVMDRLFQYNPAEPTIGAAPPSPLPEHLAKGAKKVWDGMAMGWRWGGTVDGNDVCFDS